MTPSIGLYIYMVNPSIQNCEFLFFDMEKKKGGSTHDKFGNLSDSVVYEKKFLLSLTGLKY